MNKTTTAIFSLLFMSCQASVTDIVRDAYADCRATCGDGWQEIMHLSEDGKAECICSGAFVPTSVVDQVRDGLALCEQVRDVYIQRSRLLQRCCHARKD